MHKIRISALLCNILHSWVWNTLSFLTELCLTSKIFQQEKQTALCVRRGASGTSSGTVTVIGRELPRTQRAPRPASIKTGLPPKKGAFEIWARLLISYSDNHATMKCKMLHNSAEILILCIRISKFYNFCTMWVQNLTLLGDCLSIAWFSAVNRPERENRSLQARIK